MTRGNPDHFPDDHLERQVHIESHRRMSGIDPEYSLISPVDKLTRVVLIETVELPDAAQEVRGEMAVFQAELVAYSLVEDRYT